MKKVFEIYKGDIKRIFASYAALIVVIALCILPSLYAWFNIKASWNPYSEEATSKIKIGVVNNDVGTTLRGQEINVGNTVVKELKENNSLGWQFVSEEKAIKAVKEGKYYASITIPENFSENLTSIIGDDIKKGEMIYTVNEKINAIAPKLTDKGATALQEKVSKAVVETVSEAIFGVGNELGIALEEEIPKISSIYNSLLEIQDKFDSINNITDLAYKGAIDLEDLIKEIQDDIPAVQQTIENAKGLSASVQAFLEESKDAVNNLSPIIKQDIQIINEISSDIEEYTEVIIESINSNSDIAPEILDNLIAKVSGLKNITESLINVLERLNKFTQGNLLGNIIENLDKIDDKLIIAIDNLNTIKQSVINGTEVQVNLLDRIKGIANDIKGITDGIYLSFDSTVIPTLNDIFNKSYTVAAEAIVILEEAEKKLPEVGDILNLAYSGLSEGIEGLEYMKEILPESEQMVNDLITKIGNINNDEQLQELVDLLEADVAKRSDFLANPVTITENQLYPMGNYGSAMTPFYTVLSLWVGILLLVSILTVNAQGEYKSIEIYFGKLLLFLTISCIQGLIVSLGDLFILRIYCLNPFLFVVGTIFTGIVFTFIVYSLVSIAGNVGKVIAIILLVLQVAGSGGTFPIQLTPEFFQIINPLLPFTYAISFARESIGGVVIDVLIRDTIILLIYIGISLLVGIVLKKPLNKILKGFVESFHESKIGEH